VAIIILTVSQFAQCSAINGSPEYDTSSG